MFAPKEAAREFLTNYLPPRVAATLDLASIELTKDSFVDPEFREYFSDLLYRGWFGGRAQASASWQGGMGDGNYSWDLDRRRKKRGRIEDRQEGGVERISEGAAAVTIRVLRRQLGDLHPRTLDRIRALSVGQIENLGEAALDFHTQADLAIWLDQRTDNWLWQTNSEYSSQSPRRLPKSLQNDDRPSAGHDGSGAEPEETQIPELPLILTQNRHDHRSKLFGSSRRY
jgi:hypothetical protein